MVERWNKMTVADKDAEFLDEYNHVVSDGSIPNGEDDKKTDDEEKENSYVNMELGLPRKDDDGLMDTIVKRRELDDEGKVAGKTNNNPLLDTRAYKVEFADSTTEVLTTNIIEDNLLAQVNEEGHHPTILDEMAKTIIRQTTKKKKISM